MGLGKFFVIRGAKQLLKDNLKKFEVDPTTIDDQCLDEIIKQIEKTSQWISEIKRELFVNVFTESIPIHAETIACYIHGEIEIDGSQIGSPSHHDSNPPDPILKILTKHGVKRKSNTYKDSNEHKEKVDSKNILKSPEREEEEIV